MGYISDWLSDQVAHQDKHVSSIAHDMRVCLIVYYPTTFVVIVCNIRSEIYVLLGSQSKKTPFIFS